MVRNRHSVDIERPPAVVFPYLTLPDCLLRWVGGLRAFEPLNGGEAQMGSRSRQTMRLAGRDWIFEGEVLELEPDHRMVVCTTGHGLQMTSTYVLEPAAAGTRLSVDVVSDFTKLFARLLGGIVEREGQRKLETDQRRLADLVEAETSSPS